MKKLQLIIFLAAMTLSGMAQTVGDAFYIYRNDGQFNAFFRDEVQNIEYSYEDADGNTYDEIVTQVVTTPDSVYKIPLAAIDSVGFVQPETRLQPNVVLMDIKGMTSYISSVNGMSLTFRDNMPQNIRPKTGDILVSTDYDNSLFDEGFIGKVTSVVSSSGGIVADCEKVYDITDIYEQLIAIEQLVDEHASSAPRKVSGEWISSRNPIEFNLGYSHDLSDDGEVSLSGSVNGTYIATVSYKITKEDQYVNLRINHDWQYGAHLNLKATRDFGTLVGGVTSLPVIRFPMPVPVFKFQIAGSPFIKGEGNVEADFSLNSPVHSYLFEASYHNGHFSGKNIKLPVQGGNLPSIETAFSLNGSIHAGYMVDLWLGTINAIGSYLRTGLDFYLGPKLTGDFSMKYSVGDPISYYSTYKDSKLGLSLLTVDCEAFGEASFMGHVFPKGVFFNASLQTPLYHEFYILPEFSDLTIDKDAGQKRATVSTIPTRDILFPLRLGIGLYDNTGNMIQNAFESSDYKRENEGFTVKQTFTSLELNKEYEAKPMIRILGGEIAALPTKEFKLDGETTCPDSNHPHMIDLGLPSGTKWACCNVGATTPEGYGGYYAWGETSEKSVYNWNTYQYGYFIIMTVTIVIW